MEEKESTQVRLPILDTLLGYHRHGLSVIPLHKGEKSPLIEGWTAMVDPQPEDIVADWVTKYREANWGVVLGNYVAIDVDGGEEGEAVLKHLSGGNLPETWEHPTPGGGRRLFYRWTIGVQPKKYTKSVPGKEHTGVELMGLGQQVVLPPSIHPNGNRYEWTEGRSPDDLACADVPEWMKKLMQPDKKGRRRTGRVCGFTPGRVSELAEMGFVFESGSTDTVVDVNPNRYARYIATKQMKLLVTQDDHFYRFEDGVWNHIAKRVLARDLRDVLHEGVPDFWTPSREEHYMEALKREVPMFNPSDETRDVINLSNGLLDLKTLELRPHDPEVRSTVRIALDYDAQAKCPRFDTFLLEVFEGDEERIELLEELFGYCLTAETKAEKGFIFLGNGANAKSVTARVLRALCGAANVCAIPLRRLDRAFSRYSFIGKTVNLSFENEVDANGLNTEAFKSIVSGEPIEVERKFGQPFVYEPFAKMVLLMNNLPYSKDTSAGFARRLVIIPFDRIFSEEEADRDLTVKLMDELSGILNRALRGLTRLRNNDYIFTRSVAVEDVCAEYREQINPMVAFVKERFESDETGRVNNRDVLTAFSSWCQDNGHPRLSTMGPKRFWPMFHATLKELGIRVPRKPSGSGGERFVEGLTFRTER